jgi:hypothetical protein
MKALRRYLVTDGAMGEVPEWFSLITAARYLGVPPWDLAVRPAWWMHVALAAQSAENAASKRKQVNRHADGG